MHFDRVDRVHHSPSIVLDTMIHRIEDLVPFLPNIERIEKLSVTPLPGGRLRIVRRWQGSSGNAPALVRPFLSPELLAWTDTAVWIPEEFRVEWTLSTSLSGLYDCAGINYVEPDPRAPDTVTRLRITGDLVVYPERVPGVPGFIGRRVAREVERFIIAMLSPNLTQVARGLQGFLDARQLH